MTRSQQQAIFSVILSVVILCVDQLIKIAVKTGMYLHQSIHVTDWFQILFTENRGMAFGMELFDKMFLTSFRILAVSFLIYYIAKQRQINELSFLSGIYMGNKTITHYC